MKEDWLKDIRDKMSDYEADAPQDLWARIDSAVGRRQRRSLWLRIGRYAAAAAAVVAIGIVIRSLQSDNTLEVSSSGIGHNATARVGSSTSSKPDATDRNLDAGNDSPASEIQASELGRNAYVSLAQAETNSASDISPKSAEQGNDSSLAPSVEAKESDSETFAHSLPPVQSETDRSKTNTYSGKQRDKQQPQPSQESGRLGASIYTTAGTGGTSMQRYASFGLMGISPSNANWKENPYMGMLVTNQGRIADRRVRHRLPVHAGASVAYRINDRISVEAGIAYSYLSADIHEGSDSYYFAGDQSLHYIGIPVSVRLRAVSWKNFDVYVGAGFEAEKCVSGTLKKTYVINGQTRDDGHESIRIRPLQWSANATAGVQYNISSQIGIYAEPGLSYYFDNGSDIETIYNEKPLNFNLNVGLRISFGNR